jgi:uncharacterized membrane protein YphA (DoxX/SURF4 family)
MDWPRLASKLTRYGLGIVFLIFGIWQFLDPTSWFGYLPPWATSLGSSTTLIYLNATLDTTLGLLLILGLLTRIAGIIAALHLAGIIATIGFNEVAVRDLGLAIVAVAVAAAGPDEWCLDKKFSSKITS